MESPRAQRLRRLGWLIRKKRCAFCDIRIEKPATLCNTCADAIERRI